MGNTVPSVDCRKTRQFGNEPVRASVVVALRELRMPKTGWIPSIVSNGDDENVYLVVDDLGRNGRAYREADVENTDLEVRVVAFNTTEKWSQDVSADVAHELRQRCDLQLRDVPFFLQDLDQYEGRYLDYQLPLPIRLA
jgi:hypothetical protein